MLVTVLVEIPDRVSAMRELFADIKPGGLLSVTQIIFAPHFQTRGTVTQLAEPIGFEIGTFPGNHTLYMLHLHKPTVEPCSLS